ncbi:Uu.00g025980.m01.CDS01 [Anthostomella pinea]|uniref:Uu.00g025980.m01.CDS01 n=1 Tax=Anthostomella pinea TaxID=933095 RepID=A0AAI8V7G6_9PEZI|nr:Uu.00g025980.m01.CDS01 [Anthostomella pinea]
MAQKRHAFGPGAASTRAAPPHGSWLSAEDTITVDCILTEKVPKELLVAIAKFLPPVDVKNLASTCREYFPVVIDHLYRDDIDSGRYRSVYWACATGCLPTLKQAIAVGASVNQYIEDPLRTGYTTPLLTAIDNCELEIMHFLLDKGADVNQPEQRVYCLAHFPLHKVLEAMAYGPKPDAQRDLINILKRLLTLGADADQAQLMKSEERCEETALTLAIDYPVPAEAFRLLSEDTHGIFRHKRAMVQVLVSELSDGNYGTSGIEAKAEKLRIMLKHCPPDPASSHFDTEWLDPCTALDLEGKLLLEVVLDAGYNANNLDLEGRSLIQRIAKRMKSSTVDAEDIALYGPEMIRMLLQAGAHPDLWCKEDDPEHNSALLLLSRINGKAADSAVLLLLQHGARPNICISTGTTPLHICCRYPEHIIQGIKHLIKHKADLNAKNSLGRTPLHNLCLGGTLTILKLRPWIFWCGMVPIHGHRTTVGGRLRFVP